MKQFLYPIINTAALLGMLVINGLGGSGKLTGKSMAELSAKYDTYLTPAGYAFAIWGFIFLLLILLTAYQWIQVRQPDAPVHTITRNLLLVSHTANALWVVVWMQELLWASVALMLVLLTSLVAMAARVVRLPAAHQTSNYIFVALPIAVYLGWVSIASVVNIAAVLASYLAPGAHTIQLIGAVVLLVIATGIYLFVMRLQYLGAVGLVGIWAYVAIAMRYLDREPVVAFTAAILAGFLAVMVGLQTLKRLQKNWKSTGAPV